MTQEFVHLHLHTERGSMLDGESKLQDIGEACNRHNMKYVAVTEHGNFYSLFEFVDKMKSMGITPNGGQEFYLTLDAPDVEKKTRDNFHLTILCMGVEGYKNAITLSTLANLYNSHYAPRITMEWLEKYNKGLFVLSGCISSYINQAIIAATWNKPENERDSGDRQRERTGIQYGEIDEAEKIFQWFVEVFPHRFAVEIMNHGFELEQHVIPYLLQWAKKYNVPVVATNDVHYTNEDDAEKQNTLLAITTGGGLGKDAGLTGVPNAWLKTGDEMALAFKGFIDTNDSRQKKYLSNSLMIAEQCTFERPEVKSLLPKFPVPEGYTIESYLQYKLKMGLKRKYPDAVGNKEHAAWNRVKYEYEVVCDSGFASYFLVVSDFVRWAKTQGILVGPGRGSAAGSLMAYVLDITSVDPLRYGLLFERFLNPERKSMPDIDVDFQDDRREEVIQYVAKKYGDECVAHIATFSQMGPKQAINDAARVMSIPFSQALSFSNLFFKKTEITEEDFENPMVVKQFEEMPLLRKVLKTAMTLQGKRRQAGTHASAIVITEEPISDYVAMMKPRNVSDGLNQLQIDMHDAEKMFLKMDFLGLSTLTLIAEAVTLIREIDPDFEIETVPLDDKEVYSMLSRGEVFGVFQLGESAARRVTNVLKPQTVEEIAIVSAMCRPGPVDSLPSYVARKEGKEQYSLLHPDLEPVIGDTYGFPIFQDQVMLIARVLAGYSLGEADGLRKAMGKKLPAEMALHEDRFVNGCIKKGINAKDAKNLFDDLAKFSGYGFNKAHSTCYSIISYWTAWLSYHYPEIFLASLLTSEGNDRKKIPTIIAEIRRRGIPLLPPSVNNSQSYCTVEGDGIRIGLSLVKGIGTDVAKRIFERGPYNTIQELIQKVNVNSAGIESLIGVGACDELDLQGEYARPALIAFATEYIKENQAFKTRKRLYEQKIKEGKKVRKEYKPFTEVEWDFSLKWTESEKLTAEMDAIGCFISDSPLSWLSEHDSRYTPLSEKIDVDPLEVQRDDPAFSYVLEIREISKVMYTKKDRRAMVRLIVGDAEGITMEMVLFPDVYEQVQKDLKIGAFIAGFAKLSGYGGSLGIVASQIKVLPLTSVEDMQEKYAKYQERDIMAIHVLAYNEGMESVKEMSNFLLSTFEAKGLIGDIPVYIYSSPSKGHKMDFGISSANNAKEAIKDAVRGKVGIGVYPASWDGEKWHFDEKREIGEANVQIEPTFRTSTFQELGGNIRNLH